MSWFANPTNVTGLTDLFTYANNATRLTSVSGTVLITGVFGIMILLAIWFIIYIASNVRWSPIQSFATASWICSILSIGFVIIGILDMSVSIMLFVMSFLGIFMLFIDR